MLKLMNSPRNAREQTMNLASLSAKSKILNDDKSLTFQHCERKLIQKEVPLKFRRKLIICTIIINISRESQDLTTFTVKSEIPLSPNSSSYKITCGSTKLVWVMAEKHITGEKSQKRLWNVHANLLLVIFSVANLIIEENRLF